MPRTIQKQCKDCHIAQQWVDCQLDEQEPRSNCPLSIYNKVIWNKRSLSVLLVLRKKPLRYGILKKNIDWISEKMLLTTLTILLDHWCISKTYHDGKQPISIYTLTKLGKDILDANIALAHIGQHLKQKKEETNQKASLQSS